MDFGLSATDSSAHNNQNNVLKIGQGNEPVRPLSHGSIDSISVIGLLMNKKLNIVLC